MKTIKHYLDAAKARHKLRSDYALAKKLEVGASHISNYRSGRSHPDDAMAVHLARLLDIGPLEIIAAAHENQEIVGRWQQCRNLTLRNTIMGNPLNGI